MKKIELGDGLSTIIKATTAIMNENFANASLFFRIARINSLEFPVIIL
jgi:hypothetical protein